MYAHLPIKVAGSSFFNFFFFPIIFKGLLAAAIVYAITIYFQPRKKKFLTLSFFFFVFFYRSTNAKASSVGANTAVNGYMAFLLYSVAVIACEFSIACKPLFIYLNFTCSCSICGIDDVYDCKNVCWWVSIRRRRGREAEEVLASVRMMVLLLDVNISSYSCIFFLITACM